MKTFATVTFGCKVNQYDTQAVREQLTRHGYREVEAQDTADVYIVNTCTVTATADHEALEQIRRLRRHTPHTTIVATGCFAEAGRAQLQAAGVTTVVPHRFKHRLLDFLDPSPDLVEPEKNGTGSMFPPLRISHFARHTRAFLKVQDGCRFRCAYCRVPLVRGASVSRGPQDIIAEAQRLIASGHREIVLTGICLGSYGREQRQPQQLARVMEELAALPGDFRLRLSSIEPWGITREVIRVLAQSPRWCPSLHIPFQSGSDAVLQRMRRPGSWPWYQRLVAQLYDALPQLSISADLIVGFPGETEEDFEATLHLMRTFHLRRVHWFPFSPRLGTSGAGLSGQVPPHCIQRRMRRAKAAYQAQRAALAATRIGTQATLLVEEDGGYTEAYDRVRGVPMTDQLPANHFVPIRLQAWDGEAFSGIQVTLL